MKGAGLRLRVFLLFCLMALGGIAATLAGLWMGYRQLGDPGALSAFVTAAAVSAFGIAGAVVLVWLLFDENLSKPVEALAAGMRVRTHGDVEAGIDGRAARHLGDLAPAADAMHRRLREASGAASAEIARQTARLEGQKRQLLRILSDIPVAVILAGPDHRIVLYDGQAADLMEREAPARLDGSVFDYLDGSAIRQALAEMERHGARRREIAVKGHSGALYSGHIRLFGAQDGYTLMLEPLDPDAERPLTYDFDLLERAPASDLDGTPLRDLAFAVFDSETTGLDPERDEVVQLGALRVVNGRPVPGEIFETLVNPGIPIPASATRVHRIDDRMVAGAPDFARACRAFHGFVRGAVIVAHNAPFDMAFLHRKAGEIGLRFDNPVLDTVHLSAAVFGGSAEHTLDALCARLGVEIPAELRHTAMGDAIATAEAFTAMLPILEARGIATFGALRREARKHSRILKVQD